MRSRDSRIAGELLKKGIRLKPGTQYAAICADVQVLGTNFMVPHTHGIPKATSSSSPAQRELCNRLIPIPLLCSALLYRQDLHLFPLIEATFFRTFFTVGLITLRRMSAKGLASSADVVATTAIPPVVITVPVGVIHL